MEETILWIVAACVVGMAVIMISTVRNLRAEREKTDVIIAAAVALCKLVRDLQQPRSRDANGRFTKRVGK